MAGRVEDTKAIATLKDGSITFTFTRRAQMKPTEGIEGDQIFARVAIVLYALERQVAGMDKAEPHEVGSQVHYMHLFESAGISKRVTGQSLHNSFANWVRAANKTTDGHENITCWRRFDELIRDFFHDALNHDLKKLVDWDPELQKFVESAQAAKKVLQAAKTQRSEYIVIPAHQKENARRLARSLGVWLAPGEPWTTSCWKDGVKSHVTPFPIDNKSLKGLGVVVGPLEARFCLQDQPMNVRTWTSTTFQLVENPTPQQIKPQKRPVEGNTPTTAAKKAKAQPEVATVTATKKNPKVKAASTEQLVATTANTSVEEVVDEVDREREACVAFYDSIAHRIPQLAPMAVSIPSEAEILEKFGFPKLRDLATHGSKGRLDVSGWAKKVLTETPEQVLEHLKQIALDERRTQEVVTVAEAVRKALVYVVSEYKSKCWKLGDTLDAFQSVYRRMTAEQCEPFHQLAMPLQAMWDTRIDYLLAKPGPAHPVEVTTQLLLRKEDLLAYNAELERVKRESQRVNQTKDTEIQRLQAMVRELEAKMASQNTAPLISMPIRTVQPDVSPALSISLAHEQTEMHESSHVADEVPTEEDRRASSTPIPTPSPTFLLGLQVPKDGQEGNPAVEQGGNPLLV